MEENINIWYAESASRPAKIPREVHAAKHKHYIKRATAGPAMDRQQNVGIAKRKTELQNEKCVTLTAARQQDTVKTTLWYVEASRVVPCATTGGR